LNREVFFRCEVKSFSRIKLEIPFYTYTYLLPLNSMDLIDTIGLPSDAEFVPSLYELFV